MHPGIARRAAGQMPCQVASGVFANQYHGHNRCLAADGRSHAWESPTAPRRACRAGDIGGRVYQTFGNTLYAPNASFLRAGVCEDFAAWQGAGQDLGSEVLPLPSVAEVVAMAEAVLGL